MNELFLTTLNSISAALLRIFLIAFLGAFMVRRKIFTSKDVVSFSSLMIKVLLPAMIFSNIVINLKPGEFPQWWILPLVGIGLILLGVLFAILFFAGNLKAKRSLIPIASMQNAGYLALPLGQAIYPEQFDLYALYCFLIIMGLNPILWSIGKFLNTADPNQKFHWKQLITPPFVAMITAITLVLSGLHRFLPATIVDVIDLTGSATVPMANFILGAVLGGISLRIWPPFWDVLKVTGIKFFILPMVAVLFMIWFNLKATNSLLSDVILIQAALPPAIAIMIQIKKWGGDEQQSGSMMIISYTFCLLAIPFWLATWKIL
ncbi:MAG TPA: AEC family transporter [Prolixibacteraceae bacterium]|nr:AEC family transporter [Prolixibacteraceae bacterium]